MCGYQCDKGVTKNDTRVVIHHFTAVEWYHITSRFELSNQIDGNNLVGPIGLHVIFSLMLGIIFGGKNCFTVLSALSCTSTWRFDFFFKHVMCYKQIISS